MPTFRFYSLVPFVVAMALAVPASASEAEKLPAEVRPVSYDLALVPDTDQLTFSGRVQITLDSIAPIRSIVLNQQGLTLDGAVLDKTQRATTIRADDKLQRATLTFNRPISSGRHLLAINYHGPITKGTIGFFAMEYDSPAGKRRTLATNFEPAAERRFMPSWDEPALKATLRLTVDVPSDRLAISNMPVASTEPLDATHKRVHFATTPKMSTYLFFFAVGDFERISRQSDRTEVGVVVNRGDTEKGQYALSEAAALLHYYNNYFGVAFPLPKLDLVVAPGSITGNAMENWGAIFYSQRSLLFDPQRSTESDRQGVFGTVAHEMAHQWFGDLVTMSWWDNLWLNEGFARWMQTVAADELHPEWQTGLRALDIFERGKRADAKPSTHPILQPILNAAQAEQAFDNITYDKGAAVITMLQRYVGPAAFRDGVRHYMREHAYGNTVDADLWRAVQSSAGKPVLSIEHDFTTQPGLPLIRVGEKDGQNGHNFLTLQYERFWENPAAAPPVLPPSWHIPIALLLNGQPKSILLTNPKGDDPMALSDQRPVLVNAGQSTFARVLYSDFLLERLRTNLSTLTSLDQLGILNDAWALGQSGYTPVTGYLKLATALPAQAAPPVWIQIAGTLSNIDWLYAHDPRRAVFRNFAREQLRPLAARLGWEPQPHEEANLDFLRSIVLQSLAQYGEEAVTAEARSRFDAALLHPETLSPATRRIVLAIVIHQADAHVVDRVLAQVKVTKDPLEKQNLLGLLIQVEDTVSAERVLNFAISPDGVAGSAPEMFWSLSYRHPDLAWSRALQYLNQSNTSVDSQIQLMLMPAIASNSTDPKRIEELKTYADQHIPAGARQEVESAISNIELNAQFRSERVPEINRWLAAKTN